MSNSVTEADSLLQVNDLIIEYHAGGEVVQAVNNVSFSIHRGKTLGLVGETGAGKTTIAKAIMSILPNPPAKVQGGEILFNGKDLLKQTEASLRKIRGGRISMIFQDPLTSLDPVFTVGDQIVEAIRSHDKVSKKEARERMMQVLETVGIPADRCDEYPHQFSGGMKQRVIIAMALVCTPELLIADEPTTALDVTIQAQVLNLITELKEQYHMAMIMITHDLGVVADVCDDVAVVYAGEIVEYGSKKQVFNETAHPYTKGLFDALPIMTKHKERLKPIKGLTPNPAQLPEGCKFHPRCPYATEACRKASPELLEVSPGHYTRCGRFEEGGKKHGADT